MKTAQLKIMVGWLIGLSLVSTLLVVVLLINVLSLNKRVRSLSPSSNDSSQLSNLQSSVNALPTKINNSLLRAAGSSSSSQTLTCSGSLDVSLSPSIIGESLTNGGNSLDGTVPVDLTCD